MALSDKSGTSTLELPTKAKFK